MSDWDTESLRLTLFFQAPGQGGDYDLRWQAITGSEAERVQRDPRSGLREEGGLWNGAWLQLVRQPGRVDVVLMPIPAEFGESAPGEVRNIGRFDDRRAVLGELVAKLVGSGTMPVARLALGAVLLRHVPGQAAGYAQLKEYLKWLDLGENASDFLYQVNRPRRVTLGGNEFMMNRLSKWSVAQLAQAQILFQGGTVVLNGPPLPVAHACRLELDVSTEAVRSSPIPPDLLGTVFSQFEQIAAEIVDGGDVP